MKKSKENETFKKIDIGKQEIKIKDAENQNKISGIVNLQENQS